MTERKLGDAVTRYHTETIEASEHWIVVWTDQDAPALASVQAVLAHVGTTELGQPYILKLGITRALAGTSASELVRCLPVPTELVELDRLKLLAMAGVHCEEVERVIAYNSRSPRFARNLAFAVNDYRGPEVPV